MITKSRHAPGTAPATLVSAVHPAEPPKITLIEYNRETIEEREVAQVEDVFGCKSNGKVSWINVDGIGDGALLEKIGRHFGFHPLALEDVQNMGQRPKFEEYDDYFFIVMKMVFGDPGKCVAFEQVSMFLGQNYLITFQEEGRRDVFEPVRKRLRNQRGFARGMGHDYLAYALQDAIIDHYFPVLESIGEIIEDLEDELLERPTRACVTRLHEIKRALLQLRRSAWPERELVNAMSRDESGLITHETKMFLRDCYDHTIQIMDVIESYRDLTAGMMDLYLSSLGMRTNEIMRVLTVVTTIFIPLTFIAGVYGMNFDTASPFNMPELKYRYGYAICMFGMGLMAFVMIIFFRRKKWL